MSFQRNGRDFPLSFHLINDKGNNGEVKPSRRRVEVKSQFSSVLEFNVELKLIEIDCDGMSFVVFCHFHIPQKLIERTGDFSRMEIDQKM